MPVMTPFMPFETIVYNFNSIVNFSVGDYNTYYSWIWNYNHFILTWIWICVENVISAAVNARFVEKKKLH